MKQYSLPIFLVLMTAPLAAEVDSSWRTWAQKTWQTVSPYTKVALGVGAGVTAGLALYYWRKKRNFNGIIPHETTDTAREITQPQQYRSPYNASYYKDFNRLHQTINAFDITRSDGIIDNRIRDRMYRLLFNHYHKHSAGNSPHQLQPYFNQQPCEQLILEDYITATHTPQNHSFPLTSGEHLTVTYKPTANRSEPHQFDVTVAIVSPQPSHFKPVHFASVPSQDAPVNSSQQPKSQQQLIIPSTAITTARTNNQMGNSDHTNSYHTTDISESDNRHRRHEEHKINASVQKLQLPSRFMTSAWRILDIITWQAFGMPRVRDKSPMEPILNATTQQIIDHLDQTIDDNHAEELQLLFCKESVFRNNRFSIMVKTKTTTPQNLSLLIPGTIKQFSITFDPSASDPSLFNAIFSVSPASETTLLAQFFPKVLSNIIAEYAT